MWTWEWFWSKSDPEVKLISDESVSNESWVCMYMFNTFIFVALSVFSFWLVLLSCLKLGHQRHLLSACWITSGAITDILIESFVTIDVNVHWFKKKFRKGERRGGGQWCEVMRWLWGCGESDCVFVVSIPLPPPVCSCSLYGCMLHGVLWMLCWMWHFHWLWIL